MATSVSPLHNFSSLNIVVKYPKNQSLALSEFVFIS